MKIRTMGRHIRDAVKSLFRNGWQTFGAISAVSMTLILVGILVSLLFNMNKIATDIEQDVNVRVYIDLAADETKRDELEASIKALDAVQSVTFRSKDEELADITKSVAQEFEMFKNDSNPLRDAFDVSTKEPRQTKEVAEAIEKMDYVARVNYGGARADTLFQVVGAIRNIGSGVVVVLVFIAIFLISNTIRATIYARRTEIEIMQLVGATKAYIRWPFFLEGGFIGVLGSIIPIALLWFLYLVAYQNASNWFAGSSFSLLAPDPFLYNLSYIMALGGVLIGSFGSLFSMRRFMKK